MNRQHKCPTQCEKDNCLNARREELLLRNAPRTGCDAAPAALSCCAKPTPCMADACDKTVCYKENFFVKPTSQCESPALTGYGKQYVSNTGKMVHPPLVSSSSSVRGSTAPAVVWEGGGVVNEG